MVANRLVSGYEGFPGTLCIEVNDVIVHGFPSNYVLRDGDIVGIDTVVEKDGFMGDSCYTFAVGEVDAASSQVSVALQKKRSTSASRPAAPANA